AYLVGERALRNYTTIMPVDETSVKDPLPDTVVPTPPPVPESFADAGINDQATPFTQRSPGLIIPVVGVTPDQLIDTFSSSRSEDRFHDAIDIAAPAGTPVVAATDGEIIKFFDSERGGITIYQLTADRRFVLYYAHLQKRADELQIGMKVTQGATIGFVGDTGNAGAGNYHLHFSIAMVTDPKRAWEGIYINPYPLLRDGTYPQAP
ncbi:MAG TPA: M23 family metallopeptidase, partial [Pyrinomonadaceae bacterium]